MDSKKYSQEGNKSEFRLSSDPYFSELTTAPLNSKMSSVSSDEFREIYLCTHSTSLYITTNYTN